MKWPSWLKGKLTATPGTQVTGFDQAAIIRSCAKRIYETAEKNTERMREQDAQWKYETRESLTFLVEAVKGGFKATSVTEPGGNGHGQVWAQARRISSLETELRYALGQHYAARKLTRDYDEGRERASKVEIHLDRSFALGSKGELS